MVEDISSELLSNGASLVGFADISILDPVVKKNFTTGISIAVALDPVIIKNITEGPTIEYDKEYKSANDRLDNLSSMIAEYIGKRGYKTGYWGATNDGIYGHHLTKLPHKTMATLSGLGWIGKCALLVTRQYGSAIRLTTVLTDLNIKIPDVSISGSSCGDCTNCVDLCPGHAPSGVNWRRGMFRDEFYKPDSCRMAARKIAKERTGIKDTFCGICIANCKYTKEYLDGGL
ncbi:MAG: epoxyqueuosine reductase [Spirochaetales bacterium]|nr:epoxyqueuosine reductase [Spirochaetales bacterium]